MESKRIGKDLRLIWRDIKTNGSYANWFVGDIMELDFFGNAHYIPCISPDNKVGMYDIINGVFKSSETGTEFVAGTVYGS